MWNQKPKRRLEMDLTIEEYERLIELEAVALGCAERSLATLRAAHEELKQEYHKALQEVRRLEAKLGAVTL